MDMATFTTKAASEWGIGTGVNGTGRRERVHGFYVIDTRDNRAVHAFTGPKAEQESTDWASRLEGMLSAGQIR